MRDVAAPPRWRVYLALGRVSNLPTVWTNCVAGIALALGVVPAYPALLAALAVSFFYIGGMYLNDAFDAEFDRAMRPERPIPRGLIQRRSVGGLGLALLAAGEMLLVVRSLRAAALGFLLAALILYYSWRHKRDPLSPLVMALCRACVYFISAALAGGGWWTAVSVGAAALTLYVIVLSQIAKYDLLPGPAIAALIGGISLLDAAMVFAATGRMDLALVTACGFPLTLALQRLAPGT